MSASEVVQRVTEKLVIPDLLRAAPHVRPVLDRYGLRGCGGPLGPHETLGFFAQAHDVPLDRLLAEIRAEVSHPARAPVALPLIDAGIADTIYRPFFRAGIAVVLTLGAVWGAYLLLRIAFAHSFTAAGLHEVNAHGHAQIFGWVGLFVMGFAYQAFPRFKHTTLSRPRLAVLSWWLMVTGVIGRSVAEPLAAYWPWVAVPAVAAAGLEVIAIGLFVFVLAATWRASGKPLAFYDTYIVSALFWFVLQAVGEAVYLVATLGASGPDLLRLVATWQAPLRDVQIHGFALLMILGVSQRVFHHMYGLSAPNPRISRAALVALNTAVTGEVLGLVLMRLHNPAWAGLWYGSVLVLAVTVAVLVTGWRIFAAAPEPNRTLKFLRAAYVWLFVSLGMLVLLPAYQFGLLPWLAPDSGAAANGFSHAFYGATRHAITVGFVSLMIVGVAAKVVPVLNGVDGRSLPRLWLPFALINLGCALRVAAQTATDFSELPFPAAGVSGVLEVTGLALWGAHLWRIMAGRYTVAEPVAPSAATGPLTAGHLVSDVLDRHPGLLPTFVAFGFRPLLNPVLRRTLARGVTVDQACHYAGVEVATFLDVLNDELTGGTVAGARPLPVVEAPALAAHAGCSCCEERHPLTPH
jgi:NnrS protein/Domain of unknown function (DUF1858)